MKRMNSRYARQRKRKKRFGRVISTPSKTPPASETSIAASEMASVTPAPCNSRQP